MFSANGQKSWELVDLKQMVGEREEIKAMLVDFLRSRSVSRPLAARVVNKSTRLITHLLSLLRTVHRARYLKGACYFSNYVIQFDSWRGMLNCSCC